GGPRDPQPGNIGGTRRDTQGGPEDDRGTALPLAAAAAAPAVGSSAAVNSTDVTVARVYVAADPSADGQNALFVGGTDGDDVITANGSRDVLVGGLGRDALTAGRDDDILIGGVYLFSGDLDAVFGLMNEWRGSAGYADRLADIRAGGSDGLYALTAATVADEGAADRLYGNQEQDWFWSYLFDVNDEHGNETNR